MAASVRAMVLAVASVWSCRRLSCGALVQQELQRVREDAGSGRRHVQWRQLSAGFAARTHGTAHYVSGCRARAPCIRAAARVLSNMCDAYQPVGLREQLVRAEQC